MFVNNIFEFEKNHRLKKVINLHSPKIFVTLTRDRVEGCRSLFTKIEVERRNVLTGLVG